MERDKKTAIHPSRLAPSHSDFNISTYYILTMTTKNIVIIGGGSAGVNAAKTLSRSIDTSKYQVILINPLPYRIWLIGTLRAIVSPDFKKEIMLPYDKVFVNGNGKFVEGVVKSFEQHPNGGGSVTLESGEKIE